MDQEKKKLNRFSPWFLVCQDVEQEEQQQEEQGGGLPASCHFLSYTQVGDGI